MITSVLITALLLGQQTPPQTPTPQQQQQREEERRIAAEAARRDAEERAKEQQKMDQLQEDMQTMSRREPPTPDEIEAIRKKRYPAFVRDVSGFGMVSAAIASYASRPSLDADVLKELRKKAKSLESDVDHIVDYLLGGEDEPDPPDVDYDSKPLPERLALVKSMAPSIQLRIKKCYVDQKNSVIDANDAVELLRDLQSLKLLSHSLRR